MAPRIHVGRFDPQFLGVTIRAGRPADLQSFRYSDRTRRPQLSILSGLGDEGVISDLSRQTVLEHETRHFHDYLLYPAGLAAVRTRIFASVNGFGAGIIIKRLAGNGDADALPVPLQKWLLMAERERSAFLAEEAESAGRAFRPPPLPVLGSEDDLSEFMPGEMKFASQHEALIASCRLTLRGYSQLEGIWRSPHRDGEALSAPAIAFWEASGLFCQLAAIGRLTNAEVLNRFAGWIRSRGPRVYQMGLGLVDHCLSVLGWDLTLRNCLALTSWAQMGEYRTEMNASSPAVRLSRLIGAAEGGKRWSDDSTFADLIKGWDEVTGVSSIASLAEASKSIEKLVSGVLSPGSALAARLGTRLFASLLVAHHRMRSAFLRDPDAFIDPQTYLDERDSYPAPCIGVVVPVTDAPGAASEWVDATPPGWSPVIDFDTALGLTACARLSDAIFLPGGKSLLTSERRDVREYLDLEALRIIR